jgi:hypothetical protein
VNRRRITIHTAERMRDQLEYLDLQIMSAEIYGNAQLQRKLSRERTSIRKTLDERTEAQRGVSA